MNDAWVEQTKALLHSLLLPFWFRPATMMRKIIIYNPLREAASFQLYPEQQTNKISWEVVVVILLLNR